ncbi:MAG: MarR family winged helix-turn-helix transcriptional regulator [Bacillota bacterium]|jgi:DNA-binding MarR family transcriptional regulator
MEQSFQELDFLLQNTNYLMNQITRKYLEEKKLSLPRYWVLFNVNENRGMTMRELHNKMYLAPSSITSLVDSLVESNLLRRGSHPEDRRVIKLFITDKGKGILEEIRLFRYQKLKVALKDIDAEAYPIIIKALKTLSAFLRDKQSS